MKKNEILYLLNPFNSKFHLEKEKIKIKNKKSVLLILKEF